MEAAQFEAELLRDGFTAAIAGEYSPGLINVEHTHPFEVRGLVLQGAMVISDAEHSQHCGPGDVFVMRLGSVHREEVGAAGCHYLYGSRQAAG